MPHSLQSNDRFKTIDGLRGLAAILVVLFHLGGRLKAEIESIVPDVILGIFTYGYIGVPIFFVISGFVISLSIGNSKITSGYAGNFILRRSIRLDITYWACILVALGLAFSKTVFMEDHNFNYSVSNVLLHMFYLQDLFDVEPKISSVYWTLRLEVQFYLFYILALAISQYITSKVGGSQYKYQLIIMVTVGLYSISLEKNILTSPHSGLFFSSWHYFLIGVLTLHAVKKTPYSYIILSSWLLIEVLAQAYFEIKPYGIAGILSSIFIMACWKFGQLNSLLTGRLFAYLGTISYTLYLIHPDIGWKVISIGMSFLKQNPSPVAALLLLFISIAASIIAAHIVHILVEKPSLKLCKNVKENGFLVAFKNIKFNFLRSH